MRDPKQWLLLHVEKVVLGVMLLLLALVVSVYRPWSIEVPEKEEIRTLTEDAVRLMKDGDPDRQRPKLIPPDYKTRVWQIWREPCKDYRRPERRGVSTAAIWSPFNTILDPDRGPKTYPVPPMLKAKRVLVKAGRGEALILFELDDLLQQKQLQQLGVDEYMRGLPFVRIEILRVNRATGEATPITPPKWLPEGLPRRYGAPLDEFDARLRFAEPIYIFAQRRPAGPDEDRLRREMEDLRRRREEMERRRRAEAEERLREEKMRRELEEREARRRREMDGRSPRTPRRTTTTTKPTVRTPRRRPRRTPAKRIRPRVIDTGPVKAPESVYWFVDKNVKSGTDYEYRVVIYCKNPLFGTRKADADTPRVVKSAAATTAGQGISFPSITKWYFQGGSVTRDLQMGTFKVRRFVGGHTGFTNAEISDAIADFMRPEDEAAPVRRKQGDDETAGGLWVEQSFQVRPGEEIGKSATVSVEGEPRKVDFATGCHLVSIRDEVHVIESVRKRMVPGRDAPMTVEDVRRFVNAAKLRCAYTDPRGGLQVRWQESPPAMDKEVLPQ